MDNGVRGSLWLSTVRRATLVHLRSTPLLTWVGCVLILIFRDPGHLLVAQFWAEDGPVWYSDAYTTGWRSLAQPHSGYLQTVSRLVALLVQPLPLVQAPNFFVVCALAIQALPAVIIMSERMDELWPNLINRSLFAMVLLLLPNSQEVLANLTNSQWHLALYSFLSIVSAPPLSRLYKVLDLIIVLISGLSGPFCIFLLPLAIWQAVEVRRPVAWGKVIVLATSVCVQSLYLFNTMKITRSTAPLGANAVVLARIVATQIEAASLVGAHLMAVVATSYWWQLQITTVLITLAGGMMAIFALRRGSTMLRKALLGSGLLFAAALLAPQVSSTQPQWDVLTRVGAGNRYFFIPMLAWLSVCFTLASDKEPIVRVAARALLCLLPLGILGDLGWRHRPQNGFARKAVEFGSSPSGTVMQFPVLPSGFPPMALRKK